MKTKPLYFDDAYLRRVKAKVLKVVERGFIPDQTIFFGKSCGVKPDTGWVRFGSTEHKVNGTRNEDGAIVHLLDSGCDMNVGDGVELILDWEPRYRMMRLHTTLHIISALIWQEYGALVTGSDITPAKAKIDFDFDRSLTEEELEVLRSNVQDIIDKDVSTSTETMSLDEAVSTPGIIRTKRNVLPKGLKTVRIVKIGDIDRQADGGLHVRSTKELGTFRILKHKNKGRGIRRIEVDLVP